MNCVNYIEALLAKKTIIKTIKNKNLNSSLRLGVSVPKLRALVKKGIFKDLNQNQKLKAWNEVWKNSQIFEAKSLAIYSYQYKALTKTEWLKIKLWINQCDCWEHSDDLTKIYAQLFEEHPSWVLPEIKKWNKSKNLWKRRQSLVSLLEYSIKRKKVQPFDVLINFVENLLFDEEYYVQKALGWNSQ